MFDLRNKSVNSQQNMETLLHPSEKRRLSTEGSDSSSKLQSGINPSC